MGGSSQQAGSATNEADTGDAVMARWLQSAGLQHLAAPLAAAALDHRLLPSLLMQDYARYGVQSLEDKQKLFRLIKTISSGAEPISEPSTPPAYSRPANPSGMDAFLSPEFRGDFGAGILDLHSIDDSILFSEASISEPFSSTVSLIPSIDKGFENDFDSSLHFSKQPSKQRFIAESSPVRSSTIEKERGGRDNNVARIKVVVRKRPVNKKELSRKEEDIVSIADHSCSVTVHEPKLKVDLTAYVEKHEFFFDAVLDDHVSNDEVYNVTVEPIVPAIFQRTKATCFAYGQTGSGKTYTMQPLPLRASEDILALMQQPSYKQDGFQLWLSFFEIYGGKLYDLLNERRKLCMREDGRQQVCIVGLQEYRVSDVQLVREYIDKGNASRSTGSTGANEESSRSHAILQLVIKKGQDGTDSRAGRPAGKLSFIDLAGSERGADTTDNDRQTRMEGAEINKSLLALKECIRALDNDQGHIPFRGSKLTEVLRDSFMGDSRTVMISCISPNTGSCEHTLNTLRYADRVKGLSRGNNTKRDVSTVPFPTSQRETNTSPPPASSAQPVQQTQQVPEYQQQVRALDYQQIRAPEFQQQVRAPEYQQQLRAPDYSQQFRAPDYQQQIRPPDYPQQTRAPEYQQQVRAPEFQQQVRAPEYQQQGRPLEYQQQVRAPESQQQGRAPEFQQVRAPEYQPQARAPEYQQQLRAPEYQQQGRSVEFQQQVRVPEYQQQVRPSERFLWNSHVADRESLPDYLFLGRDENNRLTSVATEKEKVSFRDNNVETNLGNLRDSSSAPGGNAESQEQERHQLILPSRRKGLGPREEKLDRSLSMDRTSIADRNLITDRTSGQAREDISKSDGSNGIQRRQNPRDDHNSSSSQFRIKETDSELDSLQTGYDGHINAILEEEEEVISAHRKEVEDTMEIVREEMKLLAEVDRPGSRIDRYVSQLNYVLSRKAAGIVNLQARLTRFQRHLKEQEILSRTAGRQP